MRLNMLAAVMVPMLLLAACDQDHEPAPPAPTDRPTATPKPTATATPQPKATPEPTATVMPQPTATPMPTTAPHPTATPMPRATATAGPVAWDATFIAGGRFPYWSPDGSRIVFFWDVEDGNSEIYTVDADGTVACDHTARLCRPKNMDGRRNERRT